MAVGRLCPQRCPSVLRFGWWSLDAGQRMMPALLSRLPQDLSYNQLTECPRELENAKNMLVLNLGHNRWVWARAATSHWPWPPPSITPLHSRSHSLPLSMREPRAGAGSG